MISILKTLFDYPNRLNEGFATVFEYLLVDREYSDLRMNELFTIINVQGAFRPDSLQSTHPMTYNGNTQGLIIYNKGNGNPPRSIFCGSTNCNIFHTSQLEV